MNKSLPPFSSSPNLTKTKQSGIWVYSRKKQGNAKFWIVVVWGGEQENGLGGAQRCMRVTVHVLVLGLGGKFIGKFIFLIKI